MKVGQALTFVNTGEIVTVKLPDGTNIVALAGNVINSSKVLLAGGYAWSETSPLNVLQSTELHRYEDRIREEDEDVAILPFQVLFLSDEGVWLGGDRPQVLITNYELPVTNGGINNLGNLDFLAVWEQEDCNVIQTKNFSSLINSIASSFCPLPSAFWIGAGILTTEIQRAEVPEVNPVVVETGESWPTGAKVPPYPIFYSPNADRQGTKRETKITEDGLYNYSQQEQWDYQQIATGGSPNQDPFTAILPLCDFTTSGTTYAAEFARHTQFDYSQTITESFLGDVRVWWNNRSYVTTRVENYDETYTLVQSPASFLSTTYYACTEIYSIPGFPGFGLYQWIGGSTYAQFTGETTTITRSYTKTVNEELEHPISQVELRVTSYNLSEEYNENSTLIYPSENWTLPQGVYGYDFEVQGQEQKTISHNTDTVEKKSEPLLLSISGVEALFFEQQDDTLNQKLEQKTSSISKILRDNTTGALVPSSWTVTTIIDKVEARHLVYTDGNNVFHLPIDTSFHFTVNNSRYSPGLGRFTLLREDGTPITQGSLQYFTHYREEKNRITNSIEYYDTVGNNIPFWYDLVDRLVFVLALERRYTGTIVDVDYDDNPNPDLEIDIIRTINSITLELISEEDYPMAEPNTYEIYPQDNATSRIFKLLNSDERNYCNLVGNTIYYSKSVLTRLDAVEQTAEVFQVLNDSIVQLNSETGGFVPVSGSDRVLGISYRPVGTRL